MQGRKEKDSVNIKILEKRKLQKRGCQCKVMRKGRERALVIQKGKEAISKTFLSRREMIPLSGKMLQGYSHSNVASHGGI